MKRIRFFYMSFTHAVCKPGASTLGGSGIFPNSTSHLFMYWASGWFARGECSGEKKRKGLGEGDTHKITRDASPGDSAQVVRICGPSSCYAAGLSIASPGDR